MTDRSNTAEGLFAAPRAPLEQAPAPLAARMRPRTLDEFVGQEEIVGPGTALRRAIENDRLTSVVFWGPPGCGKSTLALVVSRTSRAAFESYSAVTAGVADVRQVIARARERRRKLGQRTILFVDEIHRWNKAQQDALLPHVEDGTVILIGTTTENPFFEVNAPLVSRSRIFRFQPLSDSHIEQLVRNALTDAERGLGLPEACLADDALEHVVSMAGGDARNALNALEAAASAAQTLDGPVRITLALVEQAVQRRALGYDKRGDEHYDTISAFIKSVRGSDPDAAIYWLAKMLDAGEEPRFIARRLVILASEDIGNADPMALVLAQAAADAVMFVGMPEAQLTLAQATTYLAAAPKSNRSMVALNRAQKDIRERGAAPVPLHLRNAPHPGLEGFGHGKGYLYPHDYPGGWVEQEYVPDAARSGPYYEPSDIGRESRIKASMQERRARSESSDRPDRSDPSERVDQ